MIYEKTVSEDTQKGKKVERASNCEVISGKTKCDQDVDSKSTVNICTIVPHLQMLNHIFSLHICVISLQLRLLSGV
jgi:hypothetical protein